MTKKQEGRASSIWSLAAVIGILSVSMAVVYVLTLNFQRVNYLNETRDLVYDVKGEILKNNVQQIVLDIQQYKDWEVNRNWDLIRNFGTRLGSEPGTAYDVITSTNGGSLRINGLRFYIWDEESDSVIYADTNVEARTLGEMKAAVTPRLGVFATFKKDEQTVVCGTPEDLIDFRTKQYIHNKLYSLDFEDNAYIWVNEILNYDGGDNYAVRRIHPSLRDTEGMFLSTNTVDIEGNTPYLDELEGIKASGECFFTYYSEKPNSTQVAQKYTYACLYEPYNWVICMGLYNEDLDAYTDRVTSGSNTITLVGICLILALLSLIIFYVARIIRQSEKERFGQEKEKLTRDAMVDALTGAGNRRFGLARLTELFRDYKSSGVNSALVMMDVDFFKQLNDSYGHETGDRVLAALADAFRRHFRSEDVLIRWGGDEFVLVIRSVNQEHREMIRTKFQNTVKSISVQADGKELDVHLSAGATFFHAEDANFMDAVNRADGALYCAKRHHKGTLVEDW